MKKKMNEKDKELHKARIALGKHRSLQKAQDILEMNESDRKKFEDDMDNYIKKRQEPFMRKAKTYDGKPKYSEIDFTGIDLIECLKKQNENLH
jgi:hypothetical protein